MELITTKLPEYISNTFRRCTVFHLAIWCQFIIVCSAQEFRETNGNTAAVSQVSIPQDSVLVDLSYNQITSLRNGDFVHLNQLENLYLIHNQINLIEFGAFNGLSALKRLFLQNNLITEFPDLSGLEELIELYLQDNEIASVPGTIQISSSNRIERLDLSHNKFTFVPNNFLTHFQSLRQLRICCGELTAVPPVYEIINSLQILELQNNSISIVQSQSFTDGNTESNIRELSLDNNICTIEDGLFQSLKDLLILNLNGLRLTELPDLSGNTDNLRELHIANNNLTALSSDRILGSPPDYTKLVSLIKLNAAFNKISSLERQLFISLRNLKELNLGSNQIENFPFTSLAQTQNLEYLNLESNHIEIVEEWGVTGRNLKIDVTDNPLDCRTICWVVTSNYTTFDQEKLEELTSQQACAKPQEMISFTWQDIHRSPDIVCTNPGSTTSTSTESTVSDGNNDGNSNETEDKSESEKDSSNTLSIVIGVAIAVFVVAAIVAIISVIKYRVCGKKDSDVVLIRKMESDSRTGGQTKQTKKMENGKNNEGNEENSIRRKRGQRPSSKRSRYSKSPRNSRLQTISEKSEDVNDSKNGNRVNKDKDMKTDSTRRSKKNTSDDVKGRKNEVTKKDKNIMNSDKRSERHKNNELDTFDRDPTMSQELPYEYTYRV